MAILANQKILTLDYWKFAYDLKVGDYIFNKEGKLQKVTVVQEYRSDDCYRITFNDKLTVEGDKHLGLQIEDKKYRDRLDEYKGKYKFKRPLKFRKVSELSETNLKRNDGRCAFSIPTTKPLEFPHQTLPVPPFIFGFWFFNHRYDRRMYFTPGNKEPIAQAFKDHGYIITDRGKHCTNGERMFSVSPTVESHLVYNVLSRIPNNYLLASAEQRMELLQGILYSKSRQYIKSRDIFSIPSKSYGLILQIQSLIESLGHRTSLEYITTENAYRLTFRSKLPLVINKTPNTKPVVHNARRYIKTIEKLPPQLCVHIETEGADNSFLVGEGFIAVC